MEQLKFNCRYCNARLEAEYDWIGQPVECPACHKTFFVSSLLDDAHSTMCEYRKKYPELSDFDLARLQLHKKQYRAMAELLPSRDLSAEQRLLLETELYYMKEEYDNARKLAEVCIRLYPESPSGCCRMAEILDDGFLKRKQAITYSTKAIALDGNFAEAYVIRGNTKRWMEPADNAGAQKDYEAALKINPRREDAYSGLGWVCLNEQRDPEKALSFFRKSMEYDKYSVNYGSRQGAAEAALKLFEDPDKRERRLIEDAMKWVRTAREMAGPKWFVQVTAARTFLYAAAFLSDEDLYREAFIEASRGVNDCPKDSLNGLAALASCALNEYFKDEDGGDDDR